MTEGASASSANANTIRNATPNPEPRAKLVRQTISRSPRATTTRHLIRKTRSLCTCVQSYVSHEFRSGKWLSDAPARTSACKWLKNRQTTLTDYLRSSLRRPGDWRRSLDDQVGGKSPRSTRRRGPARRSLWCLKRHAQYSASQLGNGRRGALFDRKRIPDIRYAAGHAALPGRIDTAW